MSRVHSTHHYWCVATIYVLLVICGLTFTGAARGIHNLIRNKPLLQHYNSGSSAYSRLSGCETNIDNINFHYIYS